MRMSARHRSSGASIGRRQPERRTTTSTDAFQVEGPENTQPAECSREISDQGNEAVGPPPGRSR
jgi:hypothetical protein